MVRVAATIRFFNRFWGVHSVLSVFPSDVVDPTYYRWMEGVVDWCLLSIVVRGLSISGRAEPTRSLVMTFGTPVADVLSLSSCSVDASAIQSPLRSLCSLPI